MCWFHANLTIGHAHANERPFLFWDDSQWVVSLESTDVMCKARQIVWIFLEAPDGVCFSSDWHRSLILSPPPRPVELVKLSKAPKERLQKEEHALNNSGGSSSSSGFLSNKTNEFQSIFRFFSWRKPRQWTRICCASAANTHTHTHSRPVHP